MNKSIKNRIYFVVALVFLLSSSLLKTYEKKKSAQIINPSKIESVLHPIENELENTIQNVNQKLNRLKNGKNNETDRLFSDFIELFNLKFTILIYKNDTLKFWSKNETPAPFVYIDSLFNETKVINLENGWYDTRSIENKNYNIVGLFKIKDSYFYNNQYLKTNFLIDADIPSSVLISTSPVSFAKNIKNNKNQYAFSLIPSQSVENKEQNSELPTILFFLSLVFTLLLINNILKLHSEQNNSFKTNIILGIGTVLLFTIFINKYLSLFFSDSHFFTKTYYSGQAFFSTLGEVFINSSILLFISANLFKMFPFQFYMEKLWERNKSVFNLSILISTILLILYFNFITNLASDLILNSTLSYDLHNITKLNIYNLFSRIIIGVLFLSFIFLADHFIKLFGIFIKNKTTFFILLSALIITIIFNEFRIINTGYLSNTFALIILFSISIIRYLKQDYSYYSIITIIFIFSVFFGIQEIKNTQLREKGIKENLINQLADERDEMAERFLREINNRLINDTILTNAVTNVCNNQDLIVHEYLARKYFYGFWEKYNLSVSLCGNTELYNTENQSSNCFGYYFNKYNTVGRKIPNTIFWFLNDNSGKVSYSGVIDIPESKDIRKLSLYINLTEKLISKRLGYPKLLIDKSTPVNKGFEEYSYAKYNNGVLAVKSGNYQYDLTDKDFPDNKLTTELITTKGYEHIVLSKKNGQKIILSKEKISLFNYITSIAYLFVLYNILVFISVIIIRYRLAFNKIKFGFTNRIRFSMISILIISFLIFGSVTIYNIVNQDKKNTNKEITEKIQSVQIELEHKLQDVDELTPKWRTEQYDHLDELLIKFSQVFFSDINLFDLNGYLLASSISEIFNRGIIGKEMHSNAFYNMAIRKKTEFIQKEKIGTIEFSSIYIPLKNDNNKLIAYINLPYFTKNDQLQKNISSVIIATFNLYLVLFLFTGFLAFVISTELTRPLRMLQSKFKTVQLGKKHHEIVYTKKDEIGELVKEYNLMVSKLELSAKRLAESERESAWREMAKQIAHEIKNPLTPMKLSIQLLQKTWYDNENNFTDFEKRLNNVSEILIEQINTLSAIASEFSAFAKMPKTRNEEVDIVKKLKSVTGLFANTKNIEISLNLNKIEQAYIIADKEQLSRVFINLIKNAIQAIPKNKKGKIKLSLSNQQTRIRVIISDNGAGIPDDKKERLFEPSFTTKTTGMGIGLAIVKNIVNSAGGDIWFESKINKGTKFYLEFLKI
jgi:signal transduction histidine kinase